MKKLITNAMILSWFSHYSTQITADNFCGLDRATGPVCVSVCAEINF